MDGQGGPAGGADLLAEEPLEEAGPAEAVPTGHQAVCSDDGLLAHCAAHLVLQLLRPVPLQPHDFDDPAGTCVGVLPIHSGVSMSATKIQAK